MKILKKLGWVALIALVVSQFFGPEPNDGDLASLDAFMQDTKPADDVTIILKETCFDCHSSKTRYPWYSKITPVNYWMNNHIKHGREHLDFSKWDGYSAKKKDHKLEELIEEVKGKEMPLPSYTWTHRDAKLSDEQINTLVEWADNLRLKYSLEQRPQ